jgi:hypothetical protein
MDVVRGDVLHVWCEALYVPGISNHHASFCLHTGEHLTLLIYALQHYVSGEPLKLEEWPTIGVTFSILG